MNARHPPTAVIAILICLLLAVPVGVSAQVAQSAGKITAVVPIVNVVRGAQQVAASTSQQVFWGDVINTGHLARARVALDDGSVLSTGIAPVKDTYDVMLLPGKKHITALRLEVPAPLFCAGCAQTIRKRMGADGAASW